jgi:hypothetical protein
MSSRGCSNGSRPTSDSPNLIARTALGEPALPQGNELLLRRPASGREALRLEEAPGVRQRSQVLRVAEIEIGLRAGTERDGVTVGVLLRQDVDSAG